MPARHAKMEARALNKAMDICASVQTGLLEGSVKLQYVSQRLHIEVEIVIQFKIIIELLYADNVTFTLDRGNPFSPAGPF